MRALRPLFTVLCLLALNNYALAVVMPDHAASMHAPMGLVASDTGGPHGSLMGMPDGDCCGSGNQGQEPCGTQGGCDCTMGVCQMPPLQGAVVTGGLYDLVPSIIPTFPRLAAVPNSRLERLLRPPIA